MSFNCVHSSLGYFLVFKNLDIDRYRVLIWIHQEPGSMNLDSQHFLRPNVRVDYGFKNTNETGNLLIFYLISWRFLPQSTHRVAVVDFCRTVPYIPSWWKNQPWLVRVGDVCPCPPPFMLLPSRTRLQCTLQLCGQIHSLYFISTSICTLWFLLLYKRLTSLVLGAVSPGGGDTREEEEKVVPRNALQMWTDDDLATLAKYIKKFPGGTVDRWERFWLRIRRILSFLLVLRSQKYFLRFRLHGAANPNFESGSSSGFCSRLFYKIPYV